jgi:hypothetical protein
MYTLAAGEKTTLVMAYTETMLVRGEVVTSENIRINTWLRTAGVPEYMHILRPQVLLFGSGSVKTLSYSQIYLPVAKVLGFHPVLPADNTLDYAVDEPNREMVPLTALVGTFQFKCKLRISTLSGLKTTLEMAHSSWTSIYDVEITNPYLAQMPPLQVPMILVNPKQISLAMEGN